jgi:hypothetical protein
MPSGAGTTSDGEGDSVLGCVHTCAAVCVQQCSVRQLWCFHQLSTVHSVSNLRMRTRLYCDVQLGAVLLFSYHNHLPLKHLPKLPLLLLYFCRSTSCHAVCAVCCVLYAVCCVSCAVCCCVLCTVCAVLRCVLCAGCCCVLCAAVCCAACCVPCVLCVLCVLCAVCPTGG